MVGSSPLPNFCWILELPGGRARARAVLTHSRDELQGSCLVSPPGFIYNEQQVEKYVEQEEGHLVKTGVVNQRFTDVRFREGCCILQVHAT